MVSWQPPRRSDASNSIDDIPANIQKLTDATVGPFAGKVHRVCGRHSKLQSCASRSDSGRKAQQTWRNLHSLAAVLWECGAAGRHCSSSSRPSRRTLSGTPKCAFRPSGLRPMGGQPAAQAVVLPAVNDEMLASDAAPRGASAASRAASAPRGAARTPVTPRRAAAPAGRRFRRRQHDARTCSTRCAPPMNVRQRQATTSSRAAQAVVRARARRAGARAGGAACGCAEKAAFRATRECGCARVRRRGTVDAGASERGRSDVAAGRRAGRRARARPGPSTPSSSARACALTQP